MNHCFCSNNKQNLHHYHYHHQEEEGGGEEERTLHEHSKECSHLVIPHKYVVNSSNSRRWSNTVTTPEEGEQHIGFLVNGSLECYTPSLERLEGKGCQLSFKSKRLCCESELGPCPLHLIPCNGSNHSNSMLIRHGNHYDHLVKSESGGYVMHHHAPTKSDGICVDHGVLAPLLASNPPKVTGNSEWIKHALSYFDLMLIDENLNWFESSSFSSSSMELTNAKLHVGGLCCSSEIPLVEQVLYGLPGVVQGSVSFNLVSRDVTVKYDKNTCKPDILVNALNEAHLDASYYSKLDVEETTSTETKKKIRKTSTPQWNVILGFILWLLSFLSFLEEPPYMYEFRWLSVVACALCLPRIALKGFSALRRYRLDVNCLMLIAVVGALALEDFEEAGGVVVIFSLSHWLEDLATSKARLSLEKILEMKPENARILPNGELDQTIQKVVDVESVQIGDFCLVRPGDKVPVDGILVQGTGSLDESSLTGESIPVHKIMGDSLQAGTIHVGNTLFVLKATALSKDSAVARLVKLVEESSSHRSPTEQIVDKVAAIYTPIVVLAALLLGTIPFAFGTQVGLEYVYIALTLLVVACPCAFVISTPITYICGIAKAAEQGIIVKGGKYLETLAAVQVLAVDKTGTITSGSFSVINFETIENTTAEISTASNMNDYCKVQLNIPKMCCKKEAAIVTDVVQEIFGPDQVTVSFEIPKRLATIVSTSPSMNPELFKSVGDIQAKMIEKNAKLVSTQVCFNNLKVQNFLITEHKNIKEILKEIPDILHAEVTTTTTPAPARIIISFYLPLSISVDSVIENLKNRGIESSLSSALNDTITSLNRTEILQLVAAMELNSVHPLSLAVQQFAFIEGVKKARDDLIEDLQIIPGQGLSGKIKGSESVISIGNKRILGLNTNDSDMVCQNWSSKYESQGATLSFVSLNRKLIAMFAASDTIRPEAQESLESVTKLGIKIVMLTGDNEGSALAVSNALSPLISEIHAGLRPEDKVEWIKMLREDKSNRKQVVVAMIGDGVNDAPSLAIANVSFAMGVAGSPIAIESADIALMDSDLRKISWIISLGRSVRFKVITNLSLSILIKVIMIGLSIAGYISLGAAIGVDVGAMLLVTLNGVDLLRTKKVQNSHKVPELLIP